MKAIIIGGNAAGLSAASAIKKNKQIEVIVYESGEYVSYGACGIPYFIKGEIKSVDSLITLTAPKLADRGIPVLTSHKVVDVDFKNKEIQVFDLKNQKTFSDKYDFLVIATGTDVIKVPSISIDHPRVIQVHDLAESIKIKEFISTQKEEIKSVVIIGLGYIGLEMVEAYLNYNIKDITMIGEKMIFSEEYNQKIVEHLKKHGVKVKHGVTVQSVEPVSDSKVKIKSSDGEVIETDLLQVSIGVIPMTNIFKDKGMDMERNGAIIVDKFQKTNIPGVFAAGDCCVAYHNLKKKNVYIPLAPAANKQGRVAGEVIAGTPTRGFPGILGAAIFKCLDIYCAMTGLKLDEAKEIGYNADFVSIEHREIAHYYPNSRVMSLKIVFDIETQKLLGAEIIAYTPMAAKKIDVLTTAISGNFTVEMLQDLDLTYAPPFAPVWDAILIAANLADKKLKK